ncbi:DUF4326 domain-containing protein [Streptomyces sp. NPDC059994]|uniref:DUF4326 domain-containing protein n=1 Tax=Streptomyces sp. NPDC059994 TaxID=3347029 RepID=UPI003693FD76
MVSPIRIKRERTKGWRVEDHVTSPLGAKYVGRPTLYGNPFQVARVGKVWIVYVDAAPGVAGRTVAIVSDERKARQIAVDNFRASLRTPGGSEQAEFFAHKLRGWDLMCWCPLPTDGEPDHCHAAVLLEIANEEHTT